MDGAEHGHLPSVPRLPRCNESPTALGERPRGETGWHTARAASPRDSGPGALASVVLVALEMFVRAVAGCVLAALVCAACPRTAGAQGVDPVERARELFVEASELRDQGDLRGALEKFDAAHALAVNPITTFELARTYAALGRLAEARDAYASIAQIPVRPEETERAAVARRDAVQAAAELRQRIAAQAAAPVPAPTPQAPAPSTPSIPSNPSAPPTPSTSSASAPRPGPDAASAPGPRPTLALALSEEHGSLAAPPAPDAADRSGHHLDALAYVGLGAGATGFVVGTVLAAATLSKASSIEIHCSTEACVQGSVDAGNSARDLGIAAMVSYTVAGVATAIGVADILLSKRDPAPPAAGVVVHPWIGAGSAGVNGSF